MEESWGLKGQNKLYRLSWFNEINLGEIKEKNFHEEFSVLHRKL